MKSLWVQWNLLVLLQYLINQLYVLNYDIKHTHGDTQSYHEVVKSDPYPGLSIKKVEFVGHVQKRLGTRLQNLPTKLFDGKPLI